MYSCKTQSVSIGLRSWKVAVEKWKGNVNYQLRSHRVQELCSESVESMLSAADCRASWVEQVSYYLPLTSPTYNHVYSFTIILLRSS